jgi:hypothetical protein
VALLTEADFRPGSLAEYCYGLSLTASQAPATALTAAIARMSARFDTLCNDQFEGGTGTFDFDGSGHRKLVLPKRLTAITTLSIRDDAGAYTAQSTSNVYQLHPSLYSSGSKRRGDFDWVEVLPDGEGLTGLPSGASPWYWPRGLQSVRIDGTWGWTTPPADVKYAIALLVWDHFKSKRGDLYRAARISTAEQTTEFVSVSPEDGFTGIPDVDLIVEQYRRSAFIAVA